MTAGKSGTAISSLFERCRQHDRAALIGYWPAGFPDKQTSIDVITAMVEAGVDLVEVGLAYSDPVMDGPTIQHAVDMALSAGIRVADVFDVVGASAATGAPTVVMTYWNPVERYGVDAFAAHLAESGGAGLITPDLIPDEAHQWLAAAQEHSLAPIFLVAPSSTDARLAMTADAAGGFIYATAVMGVTGQRQSTSNAAPALVERTRQVTDKPIGVGLGVSNAQQAHEVAAYADAVIIGSALVRTVMDAPDSRTGIIRLQELVGQLRTGVER